MTDSVSTANATGMAERILIVDNAPANLRLLMHMLGEHGYIVHPATNGELALQFVQTTLPDPVHNRPCRAPIACSSFIDIAEEIGLILPLGEWVLREACEQLRIWHNAGFPRMRMAVNLSPRQLAQSNFLSTIESILIESDVPASALALEITENLLLQRSEENMTALKHLSAMGIQLSIDDFGTGYSSLAYLQRFPVHTLKMDQTFVRGIGENPNDMALVTAIIAMAQSLHLNVVAEGVENQNQVDFLVARGCLAAQGFYYSKPVPAEDFLELLQKANGTTQDSPIHTSLVGAITAWSTFW